MEQEEIERLFSRFLQAGFTYEYTYEKSSDKSCVYIHRFHKGADYFDLRSVYGGEGSFVVYVKGQYRFPNLRLRHKGAFRSFRLKHLWKKPTEEEKWQFAASLLNAEADKGDFFGIPLG